MPPTTTARPSSRIGGAVTVAIIGGIIWIVNSLPIGTNSGPSSHPAPRTTQTGPHQVTITSRRTPANPATSRPPHARITVTPKPSPRERKLLLTGRWNLDSTNGITITITGTTPLYPPYQDGPSGELDQWFTTLGNPVLLTIAPHNRASDIPDIECAIYDEAGNQLTRNTTPSQRLGVKCQA